MEKNICECCGKEVQEELELRTMWNGKECMCCEECCIVVDEDECESSIDLYDYYTDKTLGENEI